MNLFGVGSGELILILVIILLVMGPERLPQLARQWGKIVRTLSQFTRTWQQFNAELNRQLTLEERAEQQRHTEALRAKANADAPTEANENTIAPPRDPATDAPLAPPEEPTHD